MNSPLYPDIVPVKVIKVSEEAAPISWTDGLSFFWPRVFLERLTGGHGKVFLTVQTPEGISALKSPSGGMREDASLYRNFLERALFTDMPASARLPFFYQKIPYQLRWLAASFIVRLNKSGKQPGGSFPLWPLDLSVDAMRDIEAFNANKPPWKNGNTVLLTHDVDTVESLANLPMFLDLEESLGVRSTSFIVPRWWKINHAIIEVAAKNGHEIGIHGYNHGNKTPFLPENQINSRMEEAVAEMKRYGCRGYRAPSLLRSLPLMRVLESYFRYDSSIPNSAGFYLKKASGCATARPFYINNIIEVPVTLPSDANYLFQGIRPDDILKNWKDTAQTVIKSGGVVNLITHCEKRYSGNLEMIGVYREFIAYLKSFNGLRFMTISEFLEGVSGGKIEKNNEILSIDFKRGNAMN